MRVLLEILKGALAKQIRMNKLTLDIVYEIHNLLIKNHLTISTAESCTGGLLSHYLTYFPKASTYFIAGVVVYSIESKKRFLGITDELISKYGVVSKEVAQEMAQKIRIITKTDYSLATTGNLGPDVLEGKEKGLIYIAVSSKIETATRELRLKLNREENKEIATQSALKLLLEMLKGYEKSD